MEKTEWHIYRLSWHQLQVLFFLARSKKGIISSVEFGKKHNYRGKTLGGIFSSLIRRKIDNRPLVIPWGKSRDGRGLRWKLNTDLISKKRLLEITTQLLI